jgi:hypothetical protein
MSGCTKPEIKPTIPNDTLIVKRDSFYIANYDVEELAISHAFDSGRVTGNVLDLSLDEISGMAVSYKEQNAVWVEEDSGNENKIYLLSTSGKTLTSFRLNIFNTDWEDIAIATGPVDSLRYIYLADIGDNNKINSVKYIYRFAEPSINAALPGETLNIQIDKISFRYPDGIKNAEAIMIDPLTKDIYVVSKEDQAIVYVAPYPQDLNHVITLIKLAALPIPSITSADVSPDGSEILMKNYGSVFHWKKKNENESMFTLIKQKPARLAYVPEQRGESICWGTDGSGYFTTSELLDSDVPILFYKRN